MNKMSYLIEMHLVERNLHGEGVRMLKDKPYLYYKSSAFSGVGIVSDTKVASLNKDQLIKQYLKFPSKNTTKQARNAQIIGDLSSL